MQVRELTIAGAWELTPKQFGDERGLFLEWYKSSHFAEITGGTLDLRQANCSVSAAGVLRGIHSTSNPPGQAKLVQCVRGAFLDVVVDLRTESPTFRHWDAVVIDDEMRNSVYLCEGLGHAIMSLEDNSTVIYLCSLEYQPELDFDIDAFDPELAIEWPTNDRAGRPLKVQRSPKDSVAQSLADALAAGILPKK